MPAPSRLTNTTYNSQSFNAGNLVDWTYDHDDDHHLAAILQTAGSPLTLDEALEMVDRKDSLPTGSR